MKIGVFCHRHDTTAQSLAQRLDILEPGCCGLFDLEAGPGESIAITDRDIRWNGASVAALDLAWISGFPYMDPVVPAAAAAADWSRWRIDHLLEQQKYSALESLFAELERRGVKLFNPRRQALNQFSKTGQLLALAHAGFAVPALLCSNDMADVEAFCGRFGEVLWRPPTGRAAWQRFTDRQRLHLVADDKPPVLLAERLSDSFVLAWCLDGEALLAVTVEPPSARPVETLGPPEDFGELLRFETLELLTVLDPEPMGDELRRIAAATGARFAAVTLALGGGRHVVYDVDVDPGIAWLPVRFRDWIIDGIAHALLGRDPDHAARPAAGLRLERPAFFLRRMLQVQYEMELSKYAVEEE